MSTSPSSLSATTSVIILDSDSVSTTSASAPSESKTVTAISSDFSIVSLRLTAIYTPSQTSILLQTPSLSSLSSVSTPIPSRSVSAIVPDGSSPSSQNTNAWIGGVVGALISGLFIGFFASFLIIWRQTRSDELELELARTRKKSFDSRGLTASPTYRSASIALDLLAPFLAIPASDKDLLTELTSLGHLIQQHVEDNYNLSSISSNPWSLSGALSDLGIISTKKGLPGPIQLANLAIDAETRYIALQHIIARVVFASMSVDSIRNSLGSLSLLPASVTSIINSVAPCEPHLGNQRAVSVALTRWRHLSAFLLNPKRSDRGCLAPDQESLKPQAQQMVNALSSALRAFVDTETRADQEKHLLGVVLECTRLGYIIFSQPAKYIYDFVSPDEKELVVCPGLQKASDDHEVSCKPETVAVPSTHSIVSEA